MPSNKLESLTDPDGSMQGFSGSVAPRLPKMICKFTRPSISAAQLKVQFCALLHLLVKLYVGSRNLISFTVCLRLQ
jgi:hypothetical protein